MKNFIAKPIGFVKNRVKEPRFGGWGEVISEVILYDEYADGLKGLDGYSHVLVFYWMDWVKCSKLRLVPQGKSEEGVPEVGIFACRCPNRPNPIAVTAVKLLKVGKKSVFVKGLDAIDKTQIIDLKPFTPVYDAIRGKLRVPGWVSKLDF